MKTQTPQRGWKAEAFPSVWALLSAYVGEEAALTDADRNVLNGYLRARDVRRILDWCDTTEVLSSIGRCRAVSQVKAFLSKNADFRTDQALKAAAVNFAKGETLCRITNKRLDWFSLHPERCDFQEEVERARRMIRRVLGPVRGMLDSVPADLSITSGATSTEPRTASKPYMKVRKRYTVTLGAVPFVRSFLKFHGFTEEPEYLLTDANRITTVPKNVKTDRTIACEPVGNLPFQLAIDKYVKRRLLKVGIDLQDQSRNQEAARIGSLDGTLATIDLSMASDTLSINTVALLLPDDWFVLLNRLRCAKYDGAFGPGVYAKFSSMGNGFTFVLETLIFFAACVAVGSGKALVYGDDIIIESHLAQRLILFLRFLGFRTNTDKTFTEGPFRESCGTDWFEGVNIRPFYHRGHPKNILDANVIANGLLAVTMPGGKVWQLLRAASIYSHRVPFGADNSAGIICTPPYTKLDYKHKGSEWIPVFRCHYSISRDCTPNKLVDPETGRKYLLKGPDVRGYLLWCLEASQRVREREERHATLSSGMVSSLRELALRTQKSLGKSSVESVVQSRIAIRNGYSVYFRPSAEVPPHLYYVGEYFAANAA